MESHASCQDPELDSELIRVCIRVLIIGIPWPHTRVFCTRYHKGAQDKSWTLHHCYAVSDVDVIPFRLHLSDHISQTCK